MDSRFTEALTGLKTGKHEIRGQEIIGDNLKCLQDGAKLKVPGTVINVVGALLQVLADRDGGCDFAIFSTWLSPLVSKKVKQGATYGTVKGHIRNAVSLRSVGISGRD